MSEQEALKIAIQFVRTIGAKTNKLKLCSSNICPKTIQREELSTMDQLDNDQLYQRYLEVFSSPFSLSFSFLKNREFYLETEEHNIDFEAVEELYNIIQNRLGEEKSIALYKQASGEFYKSFNKENKEVEDPWIIRSFFIIIQNPFMKEPC